MKIFKIRNIVSYISYFGVFLGAGNPSEIRNEASIFFILAYFRVWKTIKIRKT